MRLTYDPTVNAAYISLISEKQEGGVKNTYTCDTQEIGGMINLDFNASGQLIGIEVLDASKFLPQEFLIKAETI